MADPQPSNPLERGASRPATGSSEHGPTQVASTPPDTFSGEAPTLVGAAGAPAISSTQFAPSVAPQDLLADSLLYNAPRVKLDGVERPVLGGIHLIAKLGQGGMGAVYYGINPRLETELAVKILPLTTAQNGKELAERFVREARIAAKVRSPHIASVYDVNSENGVFYIQMEYINGKSAGAYMRELMQASGKGTDEGTALDICIAAADGLAAAHAEGIIHRDIKPDNIMIPRRRVRGSETNTSGPLISAGMPMALDFNASKLLDLGLARRLQTSSDKDLTLQDTGMGTPGFMPPEQAQDAHSAREPADVYSLGATLYALLAGHAPFRGTTPLNVAMATIQKPHEPIEETRKDLNAKTIELLNTCLQKDPANRPANGAELLAAMRACRRALGDVAPTVVRPPSGMGMTAQPPPSSKAAQIIPLTPSKPMTSKPKTASGQVSVPQRPLEFAEASRASAVKPMMTKPKEPESSGRMVWVIVACVFFAFVVGAAVLIFILIVYNSQSTDVDDSSKNSIPVQPEPTDLPPPPILPPPPVLTPPKDLFPDPKNVKQPDFIDPKNAFKTKNAFNSKNTTKPIETVQRIVPPWNGVITEIQAYPTLIVRKGDALVSIRAENVVGRGSEITSPMDGEIEEILVVKGDHVTTDTAIVTIKVKK